MRRSRKYVWGYLFFILVYCPFLIGIGVFVHEGLKARHHEFQELVLISGVMDSLERERTGDFPERYFVAWYEVRLTLQGDEHLYMVKDDVYPSLDWEKFSAKETVGSLVSLKVERVQLSEWRQRLRRTIDVYGLESSRGIYLTPEESLREIRTDAFYDTLLGLGIGVIILILVFIPIAVVTFCKSSSFLSRIFTDTYYRGG